MDLVLGDGSSGGGAGAGGIHGLVTQAESGQRRKKYIAILQNKSTLLICDHVTCM